MPDQVCMGAEMNCNFGAAPASLIVLPKNKVTTSNMPAANIMDYKPLVNIPSFGMCSSIANPEVEAATTAALGTLTPMPCEPMTTIAPWSPGASKTTLAGQPALDNSCQLNCMWGGEISFSDAGQTKCTVS